MNINGYSVSYLELTVNNRVFSCASGDNTENIPYPPRFGVYTGIEHIFPILENIRLPDNIIDPILLQFILK